MSMGLPFSGLPFTRNNALVISAVAILTMFAMFFWESPPELLMPTALTEDAQRFPYAIIDNAHSRHFDREGKLGYEFVSTTLKSFRRDFSAFKKDDYTILEAPVLTIYTGDLPWYISAETGTLTEKGELLMLKGNVRIWQQNDAEQLTELTTTELEIRPQQKMLRTPEDVTIRLPQGHLVARGMIVNLESKNIKLLDRVRGVHEPI